MSPPTSTLTPTFHPFPRLPLEIQRQIFLDSFALLESIFVTVSHVNESATFIDDEEPYTALLSTLYHLSQQTHHPALPQLLPTISVTMKADLDFFLGTGWTDLEPLPFANEVIVGTHSHGEIALPIATTVYLRVDHDILCLPSLNSIDISHFLSFPEHQALRFVAVRVRSLSEESISHFWQVFFGLKNLEIVYVLERSHQWPRPTMSELEKERVKRFKNDIKREWLKVAKGWGKEKREGPVLLYKTFVTDSENLSQIYI